ncbi:MAG: glycosyltransferase family 4 protein [Desulfomonile tiedjei]|nr:glycosyltransferase family 4 protein [Desulfomonile tiedjei]
MSTHTNREFAPHLVLFFTRGVSLGTWATVGMLAREVALYLHLVEHGFEVSFVTYGDGSDLDYADELGGIRILCNESGMALEDYERSLFSLHEDALSGCHIIKTNQTYGAELALEAARAFRKRFVARCGYMWSQNAAREHGPISPEASEARRVEEKVFRAADRVIVTTPAMLQELVERIADVAPKVTVIPNYVDTKLFRPDRSAKDPRTGIFIGRIAPEKNLAALLEAIRPLDVDLILIGEGKLRPELRQHFADLDGRVRWEGNVSNSRLPEYLNQAGFFLLPSLYEGHPKVLIEAMACGMPVIGADSPGIRELINHGNTGWLCGTDPVAIRGAIERIMSSPSLAAHLASKARQYAVENFSLEKIGEMELTLLKKVIAP